MKKDYGSRVRVMENPGIASYLWGAVGVVQVPEHRHSEDHVFVLFDEPVPQPSRHFTPMKGCFLSWEMIEVVP